MKDTNETPQEAPTNGSTNGPAKGVMKSVLKQTAFAAGGLAIGYTAYRVYQASHSEYREREEMLSRWLKDRLADLQQVLGLSQDQLAWFEHELAPVIKLANRACRKMEKLAPLVLDEISLEIEEKFLKMKMRVRKTLMLAEDVHLNALHEFYEEFRQRFFGLHSDVAHSVDAMKSEHASDQPIISDR
jgi:hypothetical protein